MYLIHRQMDTCSVSEGGPQCVNSSDLNYISPEEKDTIAPPGSVALTPRRHTS